MTLPSTGGAAVHCRGGEGGTGHLGQGAGLQGREDSLRRGRGGGRVGGGFTWPRPKTFSVHPARLQTQAGQAFSKGAPSRGGFALLQSKRHKGFHGQQHHGSRSSRRRRFASGAAPPGAARGRRARPESGRPPEDSLRLLWGARGSRSAGEAGTVRQSERNGACWAGAPKPLCPALGVGGK